jgi:cyclopropane fatty-acyl-phospholipid synthase-like methyltransferase
MWDKEANSFQKALINTNKVLMEFAGISNGEDILDAGCGVGGSAFYLAKNRNARVEGITLSDKQYVYAIRKCKELGLEKNVNFSIQDYSQTNFPDNKFDVVWAIESVTSTYNKDEFAKEAYRVLKPGGKLIIADYFSLTSSSVEHELLIKWRNLWSMAPFLNIKEYCTLFSGNGFRFAKESNVTDAIKPTAFKMYWSYLLGGPLAVIYNLFNNPTPFAKNHYKSGLYQYKALKRNLWSYNILLFIKG